MAAKYTYEDFQKMLAQSGLAAEFSDADLRLAQQNPDAGVSILNYKQDWHNAATPEAQKLANEGANRVRSQYGEYTGGATGGNYYLNDPSPNSFSYEAAPSFESSASSDAAELWDKQKNYADFSYLPAPEYTNRYDDRINNQLGRIENYGPFSYDAATDPLYSQYRKQYAREGRRATEDMLAAASAASGGMPSSYAYTAAAQQGNYYASQMTDKIPELYQLAYNKYLSDFQLENSKLSALQGAEQSDWAKYLTQLGQYNTDRGFAYDVYSDRYNRLVNDLQTAQGMEDNAYARYLDSLNQYNTDRSFAYNQFTDELASQRQEQQDAIDKATLAASQGDFSFLNDLGIDTSQNPMMYEREQTELERQRQAEQDAINAAYLAAEMGDYSQLAALGINPNAANVNDMGLAARGEYNKATGLNEQQIMQLQYYLGVTMDGWWGPESMTAAGGMTADEAYQAMLNGTLPKGAGSGGYSGGGDEDYSGYIPVPETASPTANPNETPKAKPDEDPEPGANEDQSLSQLIATGGYSGYTSTTKKQTQQKANEEGVSALATEIAKQKVQGNQTEAEKIARDAVADGIIDQQTANSLVGKKIYKSTK